MAMKRISRGSGPYDLERRMHEVDVRGSHSSLR